MKTLFKRCQKRNRQRLKKHYPKRFIENVDFKNGGKKYILLRLYIIQTDIVGYRYEDAFVSLERNGQLLVKAGFSWDGCSGPTVDDASNCRAGLVHDCLYYLADLGLFDAEKEKIRKKADRIFRVILKEDGMPFVRRWAYYRAVRKFGKKYWGDRQDG